MTRTFRRTAITFPEVIKLHASVQFRWCGKNILGESRKCGHLVIIDLTKNTNYAKVYLHECIHLLRPEWSETRVMMGERRLWRKLTGRERFLLNRKLFRRAFNSGDEP